MPGEGRVLAAPCRGIVFDLDGTLVDGYAGIAVGVNAARRAFGLDALAEDDVKRRVGHGLLHLMADVVGTEHAAEGAAIFHRVYGQVCADRALPIAGADSTLPVLRDRGFRMSVASNKPVLYSQRILDQLGLARYFTTVEGPETAGAVKPDPAMIRACLASMDVSAPVAAYVGDMTIDVESGRRAGVRVLLVATGSSSKDELLATGVPVLGSFPELLEALPNTASPKEAS